MVWSAIPIICFICAVSHSAVANLGARFTPKQLINMIKLDCGEVCDTSLEGEPGKYYNKIEKHFDCDALMGSDVMELSLTKDTPPRLHEVPEDVQKLYSYGGKVRLLNVYMNDARGIGRVHKWTEELVHEHIRDITSEKFMRVSYSKEDSLNIIRHLEDHMGNQVKGGHVLVIGSYHPWIEAILLNFGAANVTTLEYSEIVSEHPQIRTWTPETMRAHWESQGSPNFDAVVSFSSLEHSGLGRYGDSLNPWGDLITAAKAWCMTKPGGRMLLGLPTGFDGVMFNACKMYGPFQYSHLFANWDQIYTEAEMLEKGFDTPVEERKCKEFYGYQPLHVVEKGLHWKDEL